MIFEAQMYVSGQGKWWQYSNSFLYGAKLQKKVRLQRPERAWNFLLSPDTVHERCEWIIFHNGMSIHNTDWIDSAESRPIRKPGESGGIALKKRQIRTKQPVKQQKRAKWQYQVCSAFCKHNQRRGSTRIHPFSVNFATLIYTKFAFCIIGKICFSITNNQPHRNVPCYYTVHPARLSRIHYGLRFALSKIKYLSFVAWPPRRCRSALFFSKTSLAFW